MLFDEFHERSLDADLGLALARDAQALLRDDLRLLVMSATLDGARVARPAGRRAGGRERRAGISRWRPAISAATPAERIEDQVARAVRQALAEETGVVLVFLPGQGEIRRIAERAGRALAPPASISRRSTAPSTGASRTAPSQPAPPGRAQGGAGHLHRRDQPDHRGRARGDRRRPGARAALRPGQRPDPAGDRRVSRAVGRPAAGPGRAHRARRLLPAVGRGSRPAACPAFGRPEILEADLSGLALDLARWGARRRGDLAFLDPPPAGAFAEARSLLDAAGGARRRRRPDRRTAGAMADLPLPPRLAHMVAVAAATGDAPPARATSRRCSASAGLGGDDTDLRDRLRRSRARPRRQRAQGRPGAGRPLGAGARAAGRAERLSTTACCWPRPSRSGSPRRAASRASSSWPAAGAPSRADRRPGARAWLAVGELGGGDARDRILLAAPLDGQTIVDAFADQIEVEDRLIADAVGRPRGAPRVKRLGALMSDETARRRARPGGDRPPPCWARCDARGWRPAVGRGGAALRARAGLPARRGTTSWPDLSDDALLDGSTTGWRRCWTGARSLAAISRTRLDGALRGADPWDLQRRAGRPGAGAVRRPAGSAPPSTTPPRAGRASRCGCRSCSACRPIRRWRGAPLTLALLSPAHRPIQVTKDLPGFWAGSWKEVRSEMRGRYPRHLWPEDPATADPTTRAKPRVAVHTPQHVILRLDRRV